MKCTEQCKEANSACTNESCRQWIDYGEDLNCSVIAVEKNGPMTLEQVSERLGMTLVRVKQIQDNALVKIKKRISPMLHE